jgi:hypothetical protein
MGQERQVGSSGIGFWPGAGAPGEIWREIPCRRSAFLVLAAVFLTGGGPSGCTRHVFVNRTGSPGPQSYYLTAFPDRDIPGQIEEAFRAVKRIEVTGVYEHFRFSPEAAPQEGDRLGPDVLARAVETFSSSVTRQASAVQVARSNQRITLLTNQHVLDLPDTLVEYVQVAGRTASTPSVPRPIEQISVKRRQANLVADVAGIHPFEILAQNGESDLALLGASYPAGTGAELLSVLQTRIGDAERLSWGSVVYVLGHPGGYPIVTRGIVSDPGQRVTGSFLIDGLWNEGISGAPILAVRGEDGSLEWVGVARAAAGRVEHRLVPDPEAIEDMVDDRLLYEGRIYIEETQRILYGISLSVSMTTIREFVDRNRDELERLGWRVPSF